MLYILRPLIYAVLVHQIEQYKANNNNTSSTSGSGSGNNEAISATTNNTSTPRDNNSISTSVTTRLANITSHTTAIVSRVLETLSVDALLNVLALAISFVSYYYALQHVLCPIIPNVLLFGSQLY